MINKESFENVIENKKVLDKIFYNDNFQYRSLPKFQQKVEEINPRLPYTTIKDYYNNQSVVQVFKPYREEKTYHPILSYYPFERIYIDTMYLTLEKSVLAFVNIMDLFSKYAFSKVFVIPKNTSIIPASKSKNAFEEFLNTIPDKYNIGIVNSDRGSEYLGVFHNYMQDKNIIQSYSNTGDHLKQSPIERFNKTLRLMLEKYRMVDGKIDNKSLKKIIGAYNSTSHSKLNYSPNEILANEKYQVQISGYNNQLKKLYNSPDLTPPLNGHVRILLEKKTFQKVKPVWSTEIYKVEKFEYGNYTLKGIDDKLFKRNELLPVIKDYVMGNLKGESKTNSRNKLLDMIQK